MKNKGTSCKQTRHRIRRSSLRQSRQSLLSKGTANVKEKKNFGRYKQSRRRKRIRPEHKAKTLNECLATAI